MITGVEKVGPLERGCFHAASGIMGSPQLQFAWLCRKSVTSLERNTPILPLYPPQSEADIIIQIIQRKEHTKRLMRMRNTCYPQHQGILMASSDHLL
ncbi:hypothetical protein AMECASPLE_018917 [Ameca splendens]|uniref:Uncharacterized protein n=1 Tax=Ameca splendens TaxID=208324 RepID=A0ABV0ZC44_9TELE